MNSNRNIDYYKKLPWTRIFIQNTDGSFYAKIKELKGCMTEGNTIQEAASMLDDALIAWIETALNKNIKIPEPQEENLEKYSGKLLVRMPKSLHKALIEKSEIENVSLNSVVNMLLMKNISSFT